MSIEKNIAEIIQKKLEEGVIEKIIHEYVEKGVQKAMDDVFGSWGDGTKVITKKIKEVMIPYLEDHDYSEYIVKLDSVLVDVLNQTTSDNRKMLENFQELMTHETHPKVFKEENKHQKLIKLTDLFDIWKKHVAEKVDTDELDINYDDDVSYESVEVTFEVEYDADRSYSSFSYATLTFECEHDEKMNYVIRLSRWNDSSTRKENQWDLRYDKSPELKSLRYMDDFEVILLKLTQAGVDLIIDEDSGQDDVYPEAEPEASFS